MTTNDSENFQPCEGYEIKAADDFTNLKIVRIIFCLIYSLIFFLGVFGNFCVIFALIKFKNLRTVRNLFILNLSISDIFVCFLSLPITAYQILYKKWIFSEILCYLIPVMQGSSIIISTFTLTLIAVDRFVLL